jgi:hypothetical protein
MSCSSDSRPLHVIFSGMTDAGKSTLINSILSTQLQGFAQDLEGDNCFLHVDDRQCTSVIAEVNVGKQAYSLSRDKVRLGKFVITHIHTFSLLLFFLSLIPLYFVARFCEGDKVLQRRKPSATEFDGGEEEHEEEPNDTDQKRRVVVTKVQNNGTYTVRIESTGETIEDIVEEDLDPPNDGRCSLVSHLLPVS